MLFCSVLPTALIFAQPLFQTWLKFWTSSVRNATVFKSILLHDPERDTSGVLRDYLGGFGPNFVGLTGEPVSIRKTAKSFKVFFQKKPLPGGDYTMDHSTVMYILDPQARVRLMSLANRRPGDIAHDILQLLN